MEIVRDCRPGHSAFDATNMIDQPATLLPCGGTSGQRRWGSSLRGESPRNQLGSSGLTGSCSCRCHQPTSCHAPCSASSGATERFFIGVLEPRVELESQFARTAKDGALPRGADDFVDAVGRNGFVLRIESAPRDACRDLAPPVKSRADSPASRALRRFPCARCIGRPGTDRCPGSEG